MEDEVELLYKYRQVDASLKRVFLLETQKQPFP